MGKGFTVDRYNSKVYHHTSVHKSEPSSHFFLCQTFDFMDKFNNKVFENRHSKKMMKPQNVRFDL